MGVCLEHENGRICSPVAFLGKRSGKMLQLPGFFTRGSPSKMQRAVFQPILENAASYAVHFLFGVSIVLLAIGLITGGAPQDGKLRCCFVS